MSGFSQDIECPYCGFQGAQANSESRGPGRGDEEYCDVCGYYAYEPADDYEDWEEDGMHAGVQPPDEAIIPKAEEVATLLNMILESDIFDDADDELNRFQSEVLSGQIPEWLENDTSVYQEIIKVIMQ